MAQLLVVGTAPHRVGVPNSLHSLMVRCLGRVQEIFSSLSRKDTLFCFLHEALWF